VEEREREMEKLYALKEVTKLFGVSRLTLQRWDKEGKIKCLRMPSGRRRIPESEILRILGNTRKRRVGVYVRVSGYDQKEDLERQIEDIKRSVNVREEEMVVLQDIGSGLSGKRKGLKKLLRLCVEREISEIAITYPDRLTRFGYEYFVEILTLLGIKVHIVNKEPDKKSLEKELVDDMLAIVACFAGKLYGMRSSKTRKLRQKIREALTK
jgi:excisionase family DNA binding protein